jgi:N4-gp56 family major capsid protein
MALVREMVRYGKLKGGTNSYYAGGTSRATVDGKISLPMLRKVARNLLANHGKPVKEILAPSNNFNTAAIESAFLVFVHSDAESDVRDLPGFTRVADYGQRKPCHPMEIGSCERFRFIVSPELAAFANAGAAVGATGLYSTGGANVDVCPFIVCAQDAWVHVPLRGKGSFDVTHIPTGQKDKNDPHGQRGYIGAIGWFTCEITNQGWMAVIEAGVDALNTN